MTTSTLSRRVGVAAAVLGLAVPLLVSTATSATAQTTEAVAPAPPVAWAPCDYDPTFDCATYDVPLDYSRPGLGTVELALTRRAADDPANKIGSFFLNPGGPGGAGIGFAQAASEILYNDEIRAKFDIVGFDPRGVGESTGIQCFDSDQEFEDVIFPVPSLPLGFAEESLTLSAYRTWTQECEENVGPLLDHMSTLNVVKDLEVLRRAVGDRQLTYAGYSYGTLIGATYANLYPQRVRALLLDGMVDPAERTQRSLANERNRAGGFETALDGFLDLCASEGPDCAFNDGGDPQAKWDQLRERLRQGPVVVEGEEQTISTVTDTISGSLYDPYAFIPLADYLEAIYDAAFGGTDATPTALPDLSFDRFRGLSDAYSYNGADSLYAVNCVDKKLPRGSLVWPAIARQFESVHPTFGRYQAYGASVCATWPVVTNERYAGPWDRPTSNTVLIVGTTFDPATPYLFAQRATDELADARLLTLEGYGHTSIQSSLCIDDKSNNYVLTGAVPPAGTVCQQDFNPFDLFAGAAGTNPLRLAG